MSFLINLIAFLWFVRAIKFVLFWIYLWQLKEYHVGRFVDHFRTHKGRKLLWNELLAVKIALLAGVFVSAAYDIPIFHAIALVYGAEALLFIFSVATRKIKKPVATFKTLLLIVASIAVTAVFGICSLLFGANSEWIVAPLLIFDIFIAAIICAIVLAIQPFFVAARNSILNKAAKKRRQFEKLIVIGVTGSYGKTSTKEFLSTILSRKFSVLSTKDHQNSEIGIAQCILQNLSSKHDIFVVEMGSYRKGGIRLLCDIARPTMGIVTGVNEQHLALFGSLENLLSAEGGRELRDNLPVHGTLFVNGENQHCRDLYKTTQIKKKLYAMAKDRVEADIWAEEETMQKDHVSFIAMDNQKNMAHFDVKVLGKHNIQNLLGAILVARELGMTFEEIVSASHGLHPEQAGITLKTGVNGISIIDSSYSSNPDGVIADLEYLSVFSRKKVVVMPCLIELGEKSTEIHRQIGKKIAQICDLAIITTQDQFEEIKRGAGDGAGKILLCDKQDEMFEKIKQFCAAGDAVLLEGGRPKELIRLLGK